MSKKVKNIDATEPLNEGVTNPEIPETPEEGKEGGTPDPEPTPEPEEKPEGEKEPESDQEGGTKPEGEKEPGGGEKDPESDQEGGTEPEGEKEPGGGEKDPEGNRFFASFIIHNDDRIVKIKPWNNFNARIGDKIQFEVEPIFGYEIEDITVNGNSVGTESFQYEVAANIDYVVCVNAKNIEYTLTVESDTNAVTVNPESEKLKSFESAIIDSETNIETGKYIKEWRMKKESDDEDYVYKSTPQNASTNLKDYALKSAVILDNTTLRAISDTKSFSASACVNIKSAGAVFISNECPEFGESVDFEAKPNPGFEFVNWVLNGIVVGDDAELSLPITENTEVLAVFKSMPKICARACSNIPQSRQGVANEALVGTEIQVQTYEVPGFEFIKWELNGEEISKELTFNYEVTEKDAEENEEGIIEPLVFKAFFGHETITVTAKCSPVDTEVVIAPENPCVGGNVSISIPEIEGYEFVNAKDQNGKTVALPKEMTYPQFNDNNLYFNPESLNLIKLANLTEDVDLTLNYKKLK